MHVLLMLSILVSTAILSAVSSAAELPFNLEKSQTVGASICDHFGGRPFCKETNGSNCVMQALASSIRFNAWLRNPDAQKLNSFLSEKSFLDLENPARKTTWNKPVSDKVLLENLKDYVPSLRKFPQGTVVSLNSNSACGPFAGQIGLICNGMVQFVAAKPDDETKPAPMSRIAFSELEKPQRSSAPPVKCIEHAFVPKEWVDWGAFGVVPATAVDAAHGKALK